MAFEHADYYSDRGIETVFDSYDSVAIDVPNYRSPTDEAFNISSDRAADLAAIMDTKTVDGETRRTPSVSPETFLGRTRTNVGEKCALVKHAINRDVDLVFVWLAYLDTAGQVAPTVANSDRFLRECYEAAAQTTRELREYLGGDRTLLCVADHGLRDGAHTETACIGGPPAVIDDVETVTDLPDAVHAATDHGETTTDRFGRDGERVKTAEERLEELGYI
jgi:hypothetical protein